MMNEIKHLLEFLFGEGGRNNGDPEFRERQRSRNMQAREAVARHLESDAVEDLELAEQARGTPVADVLEAKAHEKLKRADEFRRGERDLIEGMLPPELWEASPGEAGEAPLEALEDDG